MGEWADRCVGVRVAGGRAGGRVSAHRPGEGLEGL